VKSLRERMDIVNAYAAVGTYRGAAALCGTTHKTVKRMLERRQAGQLEPRAPRMSNTVVVDGLIAKRIEATDGRISAKRLLPCHGVDLELTGDFNGQLTEAVATAWHVAISRT
jgi:hypothetical protein